MSHKVDFLKQQFCLSGVHLPKIVRKIKFQLLEGLDTKNLMN